MVMTVVFRHVGLYVITSTFLCFFYKIQEISTHSKSQLARLIYLNYTVDTSS